MAVASATGHPAGLSWHTACRGRDGSARRGRIPNCRNGVLTLTIDGSDADAAASKSSNAAHGTARVIRQVPYLKNVVAQDHRAVKRVMSDAGVLGV